MLEGLSPRGGGFGSYLAWIVDRAYHRRQVYRPGEAASDHSSRGSQIACIEADTFTAPMGKVPAPCIVAGGFFAPRMRLWIIARGGRSPRVSAGRSSTPRGRLRIRSRVDRGSRVSQPAGFPPRGSGFASYPAWVIARAYHSWQVYRPEEKVSDQRARGS